MLRADDLACRTFLNALIDSNMKDHLHTVMQSGDTVNLTRGEVMFHLLIHEAFHRGNISMAIQRFGVEAPGFDLPLLAIKGSYHSLVNST